MFAPFLGDTWGEKKLELLQANHNAMQDRKSVRESIYSQPQWPALGVHPTKNTLSVVPWEIRTTQSYSCYAENHNKALFFLEKVVLILRFSTYIVNITFRSSSL